MDEAPGSRGQGRMIAIKVNDAGWQAEFDSFASRLKHPVGLSKVLGREAVNVLKTHFRGKQRSEPNKLRGPRTNFWRAVANSVQSPTISGDGSVVTVAINHPAMAQKVYGGVIRAKRGKALTIPVSPEAYGRTAATFEAETGLKLFLIKTGAKGGLRGAVLATRKSLTSLQIEYILTPRVNQRPDPTALPPKQQLVDALLARARSYVDRMTTNPGSNS